MEVGLQREDQRNAPREQGRVHCAAANWWWWQCRLHLQQGGTAEHDRQAEGSRQSGGEGFTVKNYNLSSMYVFVIHSWLFNCWFFI